MEQLTEIFDLSQLRIVEFFYRARIRIYTDKIKNAESEDIDLQLTDIKVRKRREQIGFDTLVVYAVNDECQFSHVIAERTANALNTPPRYYDRKIKT